jgi:hypothetical protein
MLQVCLGRRSQVSTRLLLDGVCTGRRMQTKPPLFFGQVAEGPGGGGRGRTGAWKDDKAKKE